MDFDEFNAALNDSQHSLISSLDGSRRGRSGSNQLSSSQNSQIQLDIPSSVGGTPGYRLPSLGLASSAHKTPSGAGVGMDSFDDEGNLLLDELDFEFDADGGMVEGDAEERSRRRENANVFPTGLGRLESDGGASERVRRDHEDALGGPIRQAAVDDDGDFLMQMDDDLVLPDAEAFDPMPPAPPGLLENPEGSDEITTDPSTEESIVLPKKKRQAPLKKAVFDQEDINYRNSDFKEWQNNYVDNMKAATRAKNVLKDRNQAKANADAFLWGHGIGNIGDIVGAVKKADHPLALFGGDALRAFITNEPILETAPRGRKHARSRSPSRTPSEARTVRIRQSSADLPRGNDEEPLPAFDDDAIPLMDDSAPLEAEAGREAPTPLQDHQSSAMPWNVSTSLNSFRAGSSSLPRGRQSAIMGSLNKAGPGSRISAPSPLVNRGRLLDDFELGERNEVSPSPAERIRTSQERRDDEVEFDMYGPAAAVDTQAANNTQWLAEALETESYNFLEFVKNTAVEMEIDEGDELGQVEAETWVGFEKMFPPGGATKVVAAQAFYHVLSLATKNLLGVQQQQGDGSGLGGEVQMRVNVVA